MIKYKETFGIKSGKYIVLISHDNFQGTTVLGIKDKDNVEGSHRQYYKSL